MKIGIIGAGPSGLFSAIKLKELGLKNITLFEKSTDVAYYTRSREIDGHHLDFSTKYIPSLLINGEEIYSPIAEIIQKYNIPIQKSLGSFFYSSKKQSITARSSVLNSYGKLKIIRDFIRAFDLLFPIIEMESVEKIIATDIAKADENILDWGKRQNVESFATFISYLSDVFSSGPLSNVNAAYILRSRAYFVGGYFQNFFYGIPGLRKALLFFSAVQKKLSIFKRSPILSTELEKFLQKPLKEFSYYVCKNGYKSVFQEIAKQEKLSIHFNSNIDEISFKEDKIEIFNNNEKHVFDQLIFACPPKSISKLCKNQFDIHTLFTGLEQSRKIRSWMLRVDNWPQKGSKKEGILLDSDNLAKLGRNDLAIEGNFYGCSKENSDSHVVVAPVYSPLEQDKDQGEKVLKKDLKKFDMDVTEVITNEDFLYPRFIPNSLLEKGWFQKVAELEKDLPVTFVGECFSAPGIPAVISHTYYKVSQKFKSKNLNQ